MGVLSYISTDQCSQFLEEYLHLLSSLSFHPSQSYMYIKQMMEHHTWNYVDTRDSQKIPHVAG